MRSDNHIGQAVNATQQISNDRNPKIRALFEEVNCIMCSAERSMSDLESRCEFIIEQEPKADKQVALPGTSKGLTAMDELVTIVNRLKSINGRLVVLNERIQI